MILQASASSFQGEVGTRHILVNYGFVGCETIIRALAVSRIMGSGTWEMHAFQRFIKVSEYQHHVDDFERSSTTRVLLF